MSGFKAGFLWGVRSASVSGWQEGGKGISVADVMTAGAHGVLTEAWWPGKTTRTKRRFFIIVIHKTWRCLPTTCFRYAYFPAGR